MKKSITILLFLFLAFTGFAQEEQYSIKEEFKYATFIFEGTVVDMKVYRSEDGNICTMYRIQVHKVFKGSGKMQVGRQVVMRTIGGEIYPNRSKRGPMLDLGETGVMFADTLTANEVRDKNPRGETIPNDIILWPRFSYFKFTDMPGATPSCWYTGYGTASGLRYITIPEFYKYIEKQLRIKIRNKTNPIPAAISDSVNIRYQQERIKSYNDKLKREKQEQELKDSLKGKSGWYEQKVKRFNEAIAWQQKIKAGKKGLKKTADLYGDASITYTFENIKTSESSGLYIEYDVCARADKPDVFLERAVFHISYNTPMFGTNIVEKQNTF